VQISQDCYGLSRFNGDIKSGIWLWSTLYVSFKRYENRIGRVVDVYYA